MLIHAIACSLFLFLCNHKTVVARVYNLEIKNKEVTTMGYNYLVGRPIDKLWLMFTMATLIRTFTRCGETNPIEVYEYSDGEGTVRFVRNTVSNIVDVFQPGVCLFDKIFRTNNTKTLWEQI